MNIFAIVAATILVAVGIFVNNTANKDIQSKGEVQSENTVDRQLTPTPEANSPTPTKVQETNEQEKADRSSEVDVYIYPDAKIISRSGNAINLQVSDPAQTVTNWYENKIKQDNLNVTSFVKTDTNGQILNKLVGANSNKEVRVEIKSSSESLVEVSVQVE